MRQLLANKGAYNHMASLWKDLKSKRWTLDFSKRNYHFWDLREHQYCRLDGSAWIPKGAVGDHAKAYGEVMNEEAPEESGDLLPSSELMEVINCTDIILKEASDLWRCGWAQGPETTSGRKFIGVRQELKFRQHQVSALIDSGSGPEDDPSFEIWGELFYFYYFISID